MKLQSVPAPKFQLFQEVAIAPEKPFVMQGKEIQIPRPERGVIVGMNFTSESYAEFFNQESGWIYLVDGDFTAHADASERWEVDYFCESVLTAISNESLVVLRTA